MTNIINAIASDLNLSNDQIKKTIDLLNEGSTVAFIARYRKEVTSNLEDIEIRNIEEKLKFYTAIEDRKKEVKRLIATSLAIDERDLSKSLSSQIEQAKTMAELDDIYMPFKPKRKTRASIARDKGLEGLAKIIIQKNLAKEELEEIIENKYLNDQVKNTKEALEGASDIISELVSESTLVRAKIRKYLNKDGYIISKAKDENENSVYKDYYDYKEKIKNIPDFKVLALNRGEKENILKVSMETDLDLGKIIASTIVKDQSTYSASIYIEAIRDSYKRLIKPSIEREIRKSLTEKAEEEAIDVFAKNLRNLLLQAPLKNKRVLAIDPAIRTGCKIAILDEYGKFLAYDIIYPHEPKNEITESKERLEELIKAYNIDLIAIGNGTGSRKTEILVSDLLKSLSLDKISYTIVSEAGASIYSVSDIAREEFPEIDPTIRGAISIGRRLQDPLAELVKIQPKHIGVGQYQHDLNEKRLNDKLSDVVEDLVNQVGVNVNTASQSLLSYVSGISESVSSNIINYRSDIGGFTSRYQLKDVKGLGPKTFEQAAGFLRIPGGSNILDNTGVHPESYKVAKKLIDMDYKNTPVDELAKDLDVGVYTLEDILYELEKPGRDPRDAGHQVILKKDVLAIEDLYIGQKLKGIVRNVVDFGAFVDIGIGEDGLVHISQMSENFVKDPNDLVQIGNIIDVKVIDIDYENLRISLSMI